MSDVGIPIPVEVVDRLAAAVADRVWPLLLEQVKEAMSPWFTVEEAAEYTRTPLGTFRQQSAQGIWPSHGEGRRRVYHRDELNAVLLGNATGSPTAPAPGRLRAA